MSSYTIKIEAKIDAKNFASAQKKTDQLVALVEKRAKWSHIKLEPENGK